MPTVEFGYLVDACLLIALLTYSCYIFSMSVTQTVDIPPSRRLTIEVPHEVPVGPVILTFTSLTEAAIGEVKAASTDEAMVSARKILARHLPAFKELAK